MSLRTVILDVVVREAWMVGDPAEGGDTRENAIGLFVVSSLFSG